MFQKLPTTFQNGVSFLDQLSSSINQTLTNSINSFNGNAGNRKKKIITNKNKSSLISSKTTKSEAKRSFCQKKDKRIKGGFRTLNCLIDNTVNNKSSAGKSIRNPFCASTKLSSTSTTKSSARRFSDGFSHLYSNYKQQQQLASSKKPERSSSSSSSPSDSHQNLSSLKRSQARYNLNYYIQQQQQQRQSNSSSVLFKRCSNVANPLTTRDQQVTSTTRNEKSSSIGSIGLQFFPTTYHSTSNLFDQQQLAQKQTLEQHQPRYSTKSCDDTLHRNRANSTVASVFRDGFMRFMRSINNSNS